MCWQRYGLGLKRAHHKSSRVAPDLAAEWLIAAMKALPGKLTGLEPGTRTLEADPVLAAAIAAALKCETEH